MQVPERYRITSLAKKYAIENIKAGNIVMDATMGNGNDTLLLAQLTGSEGKVYSFDIQSKAIENTKELLSKNNACALLINDSHENLDVYIEEQLDFCVFNLGYLPGGDKHITTKRQSTLEAVKKALDKLKVGGMMTVCIYPGHSEGYEEATLLNQFFSQLSNKEVFVLYTSNINVNLSPYCIAAVKLK
ncbi:class I SAM-dependent methyltransferase [Alkalibacter mobilis]|uniref:class I SAM-dependent methyltransferase n=1 Tax=Alkalibacter mobilis TaxID=2787712 RepID=UPI00189DEAD4|nr:class I SAM-dependent methyltransferase [Alkalibacter mobilis]MBF7097631.1 methyltransferase domain-containing protein [Alkalibacter mobilis]